MPSSTMPSKKEGRSVIIVGAGLYGLAAAKSYLEINPHIDLTVLDSGSGVGGTWSTERVYPALTADSPVPTFEFGEFSMIDEFGVDMWTDIPGTQVAEYLERFARKYDIKRRCKFNTEVMKICRYGKLWQVWTRSKLSVQPVVEILECDALIVATGMTSKPCTPECNKEIIASGSTRPLCFPNLDLSQYQGAVLHTKDLNYCHKYLTGDLVKNVTVIGGNKSAAEAVSTCAMAGKTVNWVIREEGNGPGMLVNAKITGKHGAEIGNSKLGTVAMPSIYGRRGFWYRFLQSGENWLGSLIFTWFWCILTYFAIGDRYKKSENGKKLKPDVCNMFWLTSGLSICHDRDTEFMKIIDEGRLVKVSRASIKSMNERTVHLSNGTSVESDVIIFATGWHPGRNGLFEPSLAAELGIPIPVGEQDPDSAGYWNHLDIAADNKVLDIYPFLGVPPAEVRKRHQPLTQLRMFRSIIPSSFAARQDRSIAFLGNLINAQNTTFAEVSSLYAIAYLENLLSDNRLLGNKQMMDQDIALGNAFMLRRYAGRPNLPIAMMEVQDWTDLMLREMGIRTDRKRLIMERSGAKSRWAGWGYWARVLHKEWFEPCIPADYKGINQEFLQTVEMGEVINEKTGLMDGHYY